MLNVILFGLAASSALVIGAVAGAYWTPPKPLLASALAFASGALISALAFDLFQESFERLSTGELHDPVARAGRTRAREASAGAAR